jgi:hypothetical protein
MPAALPASPYAGLEKGSYRLRRPSIASPLKRRNSDSTIVISHVKKPSLATRVRTQHEKHLAMLVVVLLLAIATCFTVAYYLYSET